MTLIVGFKHNDDYIIAYDSRLTNDNDIVSENCNKCFEYKQFLMFGAGSTTTEGHIIKALNDEKVKGKDLWAIHGYDTGLDESHGTTLLAEVYDELIVSLYLVEVGKQLQLTDVLQNFGGLVAIGCGEIVFRAIFRSMIEDFKRKPSLCKIKATILKAMKMTAQVDAACNEKITMKSFKI